MAVQLVSTGLVQQQLCQDASIVIGRPPFGQASFAGRKSKRRRYLPAKTLHHICTVWPVWPILIFLPRGAVPKHLRPTTSLGTHSLLCNLAESLQEAREDGTTCSSCTEKDRQRGHEDEDCEHKRSLGSDHPCSDSAVPMEILETSQSAWKPKHVLSCFIVFFTSCETLLFRFISFILCSRFVPLHRHQISKSHCISSLVCIMHYGSSW